ncbi:sulfotransferase [Catalinimonas sp. 4WD22]|uniref:sulfotransferase n=1 Tax=Catalinimonas locisalis TaxID=3133978 RepID=UPI0031019C80
MAKLVYIVSTGHSGSTLLDLLIGSIPGVFSTGEIRRLPWQLAHKNLSEKSVDNQNICSCLKPFDKCEVWTHVVEELSKDAGCNIMDHPDKFPISMLIGHEATYKMTVKDYAYNGLYKKSLIHSNLHWLANIIYKTQLERIKNNWKLFESIEKVTGDQFIVDSSKDIARFPFLHTYRPDDTYLIVNKRDSLRFANSYIKRGLSPKNSLKARYGFYKTVYKIINNNPSIKYMDVLYEDLCENPSLLRKKIADFLGIKLSSLEYNINTKDYHLVEGNPMRYKGELNIRIDNNWKKSLSNDEFKTITQLSEKYNI